MRPYQEQVSDWFAARRAAKRQFKPLSPRRAAEFRGRRLRKLFGTHKQRAERWHHLVKLYGIEQAERLSRHNPWEGHTQNDTAL